MRRWLAILLCLVALPGLGDNHPDYKLSFSAQQTSGIPVQSNETKFDCSNQIYTIVNASNIGDEPVNVEIIWRNPYGQIQEKTPVSLYPVEGKALGWAWLKLHKSTGATLFSFLDDSIGMDNFIGDWEIELLLDNEKIAEGRFNVLC